MSRERLFEALVELQERDAQREARALLEAGEDPLQILEQCRLAMEKVGTRFQRGEYYIPQLMFASEILKDIAALIEPQIREADTNRTASNLGRVVIGTVQGDVHDIGKNIVTFLLQVNGFQVYDLGVDVSPDSFVQEIERIQPQVVGLSGFMTVAFGSMKETVEAVEAAGLRDRVKIMVGGGMVEEHVREFTGADAYGGDAMAAVTLAKAWISGGRR